MIFFPSGVAVANINHSDEPNAKLVWSNHPNHQKMWMHLEPEELLQDEYKNIGLVMEIVALRDIEKGEEIFIDYGSEWKTAYQNHVKEWNTRIASGEIPKEWPMKAVEMNELHRSEPFKYADEQDENPYPANLQLKAFLLLQDTENEGTMEDPKIWGQDEDATAYQHDHLFDVSVQSYTKMTDDSYVYTVLWVNENTGKRMYVDNVPHEALVFVDKLDTSDQMATKKPFRHYIGIPDEIFPQGPWRNLKK